jgi:hypothetical protein
VTLTIDAALVERLREQGDQPEPLFDSLLEDRPVVTLETVGGVL